MTTQAYFEHIEAQLLSELDQARGSILVAVAWFTNAQLLNKLCERRARGIAVELMILDDEINGVGTDNLNRLKAVGGKVYMITKVDGGAIMHNKFCVIDQSTVINGSYNWSYKARQNHENITITRNAERLAKQFIEEFRRLKAKYFAEEGSTTEELNIGQVLRRLSLIKQLILLDELEDLPLQLVKLQTSGQDTELSMIVESLRTGQYGIALPGIDRFIQERNQLATYVDPEIVGLRTEARALEIQLAALDNERAELEQMLHQFYIRHTQELGPLIIQILKLRVMHSRTDMEKEDAESDREEYEKGYQQQRDEVVHRLNPEEKEELKQLYRNASKMCHPDMVATEHQAESAKWFVALKDAYEHNDLQKVQEIVKKLLQGTAFGSMVDSLSELDRLSAWVKEYRARLSDLLQEIATIKNSEEYQAISVIPDWDIYFADLRRELTHELRKLQYGKS
jgi:hypothetical protein